MEFRRVGPFGGVLGVVAFGAWIAACSLQPSLMPPPVGDEGNPLDGGTANPPDAGRATTDASSYPGMDATQPPPEDASMMMNGHDAGNLEADAGAPGHDAGEPGRDASSAGQDAGAGEGDAGPWSDHTDIEAIFQKYCSNCHGTTWQSCWTDQANESSLSSAISSGAMPRGTTMAAADKSAVLAWLSSGAPCAGPYQDAGMIILGGSGTSGVATPVGYAAAPAP